MFVNGLDRITIGCVIRDDAQYGKFICQYSTGGKLQQYSFHQKCGFSSYAEAYNWFLVVFPQGNILDLENFLQIQQKLLSLTIPSLQANVFDPLHMTEKPRPAPIQKTKDGQVLSDFE